MPIAGERGRGHGYGHDYVLAGCHQSDHPLGSRRRLRRLPANRLFRQYRRPGEPQQFVALDVDDARRHADQVAGVSHFEVTSTTIVRTPNTIVPHTGTSTRSGRTERLILRQARFASTGRSPASPSASQGPASKAPAAMAWNSASCSMRRRTRRTMCLVNEDVTGTGKSLRQQWFGRGCGSDWRCADDYADQRCEFHLWNTDCADQWNADRHQRGDGRFHVRSERGLWRHSSL